MARTVPIRRSLLLNIVAVVLLLGVAIYATTFWSSRRAILQVAESLIAETLAHTEVELEGLFVPVGRQLEVMRTWGEAGLFATDRPEAVEAVMAPVMERFPALSGAMVADRSGREVLLLRAADRWSRREIRREEWGEETRWQLWSDDSPGRQEEQRILEYDPRSRPWFRGAIELREAELSTPVSLAAAGIHWTDPYTFFSLEQPGITAAVSFESPAGDVTVVGLDLLLTSISDYTATLAVHRGGRVFVMSEDRRLVGLPAASRLAGEAAEPQLLLKRPEEIGSAFAADASRELIARAGDGPVRFASEGEAWWGQVKTFDLPGSRQHLLMGVAVPERDLLGDVQRQRLWVALIVLTVLALGILQAALLARRYSRPVEGLVRQSDRMSRGDLEPGEPVESGVTEVQQLAEAQERMRRGLQTLFKLEEDLALARRIQQKTLPERLPELPGFELAAWSEPAEETGGDTYDVVGLQRSGKGGKATMSEDAASGAFLLLADATGHGIGPALSVTQLRAMVRMAVRLSPDLAEISRILNDQLCDDLPRGRFITAWLGELDSATGTLQGFSAGQAPLLFYEAATEAVHSSSADAVPFGLFGSMKIELAPPTAMAVGDIFAAISDGIFEAENPAGVEFGTDLVSDLIRSHRQEPLSDLAKAIREAVDEFTEGAPAADDRTILLVRRT